jgi:preprotein translocase subunit YajC
VDTQQIVFMVIGLILLSAFMLWPQWQTRRRRQKQIAELRVGEEVMTVGGIIGTLTHFDTDKNRARVEIAPGVELQIVLEAIGRRLTPE